MGKYGELELLGCSREEYNGKHIAEYRDYQRSPMHLFCEMSWALYVANNDAKILFRPLYIFLLAFKSSSFDLEVISVH